ncbi:MAG: hypothetical protein PVI86_18815, partial [Phycisphaerae bacterium]
MGRTLDALHNLQVIELQLAELRRDRESRERRIKYHQRHAQQAEDKLQQNQALIRERQKQLDALQLDVASREELVNRHRQGLNKAKTNKEYAAILTAMNTEKADNAKLENDILKLMDEVQAMTAGASGIEAEKAKVLEDVAKAEAELADYDKSVKAQRDELLQKREQCAEGIEPTTLSTFTRVAEHNDGEAMAVIEKMHPKRDE